MSAVDEFGYGDIGFQFDDERGKPTEPDEQSARTANFVAGLRELADECERRPELGAILAAKYRAHSLSVYASSDEEFREHVRAFGGHREKNPIGDWMEVTRYFGDHLRLEANVRRDQVCEAVEVGRETVEVVDPNAPKITIDRPVIEWQCRPIVGVA